MDQPKTQKAPSPREVIEWVRARCPSTEQSMRVTALGMMLAKNFSESDPAGFSIIVDQGGWPSEVSVLTTTEPIQAGGIPMPGSNKIN